jgi:hypothetical protein
MDRYNENVLRSGLKFELTRYVVINVKVRMLSNKALSSEEKFESETAKNRSFEGLITN